MIVDLPIVNVKTIEDVQRYLVLLTETLEEAFLDIKEGE